MQLRKILIIHDSIAVRKLLMNYIQSELNDVVVNVVESAAKGIKKLKDDIFSVVICGNQTNSMGNTTVFKEMRSLEAGRDTPFIIITSTGSKENIKDFKDQGIEHYLVSPFTPIELRSLIKEACDPRTFRKHARISVPGAKAVVHMRDYDVEANVINISESGILCDVTCVKQYNDLLNSAHMTIEFPAQYDNAKIKILWCMVFRVLVLTWDKEYFPQCAPKNLRVAWQIIEISNDGKKLLNKIFETVENEMLQFQGDS